MCIDKFSALTLLSLLVYKLAHWLDVTCSSWILRSFDKILVVFYSLTVCWSKEIKGSSYIFPASELKLVLFSFIEKWYLEALSQ